MSLDFSRAVPVSCVAEEYDYVASHPCSECNGAWQVRMQALLQDGTGRHYDRVDVYCPRCNQNKAFLFDLHSFFPNRERL